jgi:predicted phosphodiesterase
MFKVLHLTDLHIKDPKGENEFLREAFFDEYLDSLAVAVRPSLEAQLDSIVITGDFIDRGKIDNFPYASRVVEYLASKFKLPLNQIVVCNGNHDIVKSEEEAGNFAEARQPFKNFATAFGNGSAVKECTRGILIMPKERLWCLMLDATLGSKGERRAGTLENSEVDQLMGWVKEIPPSDVLLIGAHYPVHNLMAEGAMFDEDTANWSANHMWGQGEVLKERIRKLEFRPQVIWLCGDIHKNVNTCVDGQRFIATGRLGTEAEVADSLVPRHARVLLIDDDGKKDPITPLFSYTLLGHKSQAQWGRWVQIGEQQITAQTTEIFGSPLISVPRLSYDVPEEPGDTSSFDVGAKSSEEETDETAFSPIKEEEKTEEETTSSPSGIQLINPDLQEVLIDRVREARLYQLGRFNTSELEVSLAWVSIAQLLKGNSVLISVINDMSKWLKKKLDVSDSKVVDETILIGMDCWGSVIASQISASTGIRNICVAERGGGQHYLPSENLTAECFNQILNASTVVIISDVVATGRSLVRLHEKICKRDEVALTKRWLCLSVLCDEKQQRAADCSFLEAHGTACKDLRMPILAADQLPPESILPPEISFA